VFVSAPTIGGEPPPSPARDDDRPRTALVQTRLVISPATAKTHVSRAMVKLQARDRAQLVVMAYETGLVRPGWTG
jgi:hypothetical protein